MGEGVQVLIVVAFGALCFGCGYLTAFIVTRNKWRDEMMLKRGVRPLQLAHRQMGMGQAAEGNRDIEWQHATSRRPWSITKSAACFSVRRMSR